jgi:hypothetical protein
MLFPNNATPATRREQAQGRREPETLIAVT